MLQKFLEPIKRSPPFQTFAHTWNQFATKQMRPECHNNWQISPRATNCQFFFQLSLSRKIKKNVLKATSPHYSLFPLPFPGAFSSCYSPSLSLSLILPLLPPLRFLSSRRSLPTLQPLASSQKGRARPRVRRRIKSSSSSARLSEVSFPLVYFGECRRGSERADSRTIGRMFCIIDLLERETEKDRGGWESSGEPYKSGKGAEWLGFGIEAEELAGVRLLRVVPLSLISRAWERERKGMGNKVIFNEAGEFPRP